MPQAEGVGKSKGQTFNSGPAGKKTVCAGKEKEEESSASPYDTSLQMEREDALS